MGLASRHDPPRRSPVLALETRFSKNPNVPWRLIEGEAILIDQEEGELVRLNPVGAEIWAAIESTRSLDEIVDHICRTFEVSRKKASLDVSRFLTHLLRHELVQAV